MFHHQLTRVSHYFSGDVKLSGDHPFKLPQPTKMTYGSLEWGAMSPIVYTVGNEPPEPVQQFRALSLYDRVNPLLFFRGPPSAWFAFGDERDRCSGMPTADVLGLTPAPLGRFFIGAPPKTNAKGSLILDSSSEGCLPSFGYGDGGPPHALSPVAIGKREHGKMVWRYYCGFPGCSLPHLCQNHGTQNKAGVTYHIMVDHLGLLPTCIHCGEGLGRMIHKDHTKGCPGYKAVNVKTGRQTKVEYYPKKRDTECNGELYGFIMPVEWEFFGRQPRRETVGRVVTTDAHNRQGDFFIKEDALRDRLLKR